MIFRNPAGAPELACDACGCRWFDRRKGLPGMRPSDLDAAFARFQETRLPPMKKIWDAANVSIRWYERMDTLVKTLTPVEFAYSYMTRTGRVDHAEVRRRDPQLAAAYEKLHPELAGG